MNPAKPQEPAWVEVPLGARAYRVAVGRALIGRLGEWLDGLQLGIRCAVVTDSNVGALHGAATLDTLRAAGRHVDLIQVPAGEGSKSLTRLETVCDRMLTLGLDRRSFLVALGGGVVGDLAGFAAAVYGRGIPFVQIPTSVVAQVDSAVGGKTGVNLAGGKNLVGAFHQPRLVVADVDTLATLPGREYREGFAEVIKHAMIRDARLFDRLFDLATGDLVDVIRRNIEIKAAIVGVDEEDRSGQRAILNFGHTLGHAIENAAGYGRLLHGEAVALGMMAAARISVRRAGLAPAALDRMRELLGRFELPTTLDRDIPVEPILRAVWADKKFEEGRIRFVVTPEIGSAHVATDVTREELTEAVETLRKDAAS